MKTLTRVNLSDDWEGMYLENDLLLEGHQIDSYHLLKALSDKKVNFNECKNQQLSLTKNGEYEDYLDSDIIDRMGCCTETLDEFIFICKENGYEVVIE